VNCGSEGAFMRDHRSRINLLGKDTLFLSALFGMVFMVDTTFHFYSGSFR